MRICILTQPLHTNYGGLLQAYAMQQVLREMGHEVWTEDRRAGQFSLLRSFLRLPLMRRLLGKARYLTQSEYAVIKQYTARFIAENIVTTEPVYSTNKKVLEQYDFQAYVVGSDQVWRKEYSYGIENYFLDFAPENSLKIAYAASFGVSQWEFSPSLSRRLRSLAQRFDFVGVREADAVALCRDNLGVEAFHVLDPTLLLPQDAWLKLMAQDMGYKFSGDGGVATYFLDPTPQRELAVAALADSLSLSVNELNHTLRNNLFDGRKAEERVVPPVAAWLVGINNSKLLVTDSFHGVVFALIFNKQFVVYINSARGASRIMSLLNLIGLESRVVKDEDPLDLSTLDDIDFGAVNEKLKSLREKSLGLLSKALSLSLHD